MDHELYKKCLQNAEYISSVENRLDMSIVEIANYLYNEEVCKAEREKYHDQKLIDFYDEIVEIEELEERELLDIQVSGDNLFYANNILTKNSVGLPMTLDFFMAMTTDDVLQENNQQLLHLLKTRWGAKADVKPQLINIDWSRMRYSDVGSTQEVVNKVGSKKPEKKEKKVADIEWD